MGLLIINTGSPTFVRRACQTCIDLTLVSERCTYNWETANDTWGSDHFPVLLTPSSLYRRFETRRCSVINWTIFRQKLSERLETADDSTLLKELVPCTEAATTYTEVTRGKPVPDIKALNLRAARTRAHKQAIRHNTPTLWTAFRRLDAAARRHARQQRKRCWQSLCSSLDSSRGPVRAWKLFNSITQPVCALRPIHSVAIGAGIREQELAELLAEQFAPCINPIHPPPTPVPMATIFGLAHTRAGCYLLPYRVPLAEPPRRPADPRVEAACNADITLAELLTAVRRCPRGHSTPGADGITYAMLRNLDTDQQLRLLDLFNHVWRTAIVTAVLKTEQARHEREGAYLLLLDVKSAFDALTHQTIHDALDRLGAEGRLRRYGSVLSPLLFNLAMANLPSCLPESLEYPVEMAIYADDVALWTRGPTKHGRRVRATLQVAIDAVANHLTRKGLRLSEAKRRPSPSIRAQLKSEALLHFVYLGLAIDETLSWKSAVGAQLDQMIRAVRGINQLVAQGRGCSHQWALRIYRACAVSRVLYALPLVNLRDAQWKTLELAHRKALRRCVGLPRDSPVASTLTETGSWLIQLLATQRCDMWSACTEHLEVTTSSPGSAREANPAWAAWPLYSRTMSKSLRGRAFCPHRRRQPHP
ncbi:uncharacterized protein LOC144156860 [Haemaphysalis longicornis]